MSKLIPVQDADHLARDPTSQAIINTSKREYINARTRSRIAKQKEHRMNELEQNVEALTTDMADIKNILQQLLENKVEI